MSFSTRKFFSQKSFFTWNCKFLKILIDTEKTGESIIKE